VNRKACETASTGRRLRAVLGRKRGEGDLVGARREGRRVQDNRDVAVTGAVASCQRTTSFVPVDEVGD
jgi:hypothetical protein